ncbi:hypothetical protein Pan216_53600 [Planctomycetes bacterium Pan216]|uniref:Transglutaminase-like superfamily protein n=2 Tax=Kolteria novifilia TaxID=2527975 RepID=A0A518BBW5_9BACT|nr:hypothetical protein Pan216_53600 [Planctomycetes bacterium Pan216]
MTPTQATETTTQRLFGQFLPLTLLLALVVGGCNSKSPSTTTKAEEATSEESKEEANELLSSALNMLEQGTDPQSLPTAIRQLNQFVARDREAIEKLDKESEATLTRILGEQAVAIATRPTFDEIDADYLRTCLFLHSAARTTASNEEPPLTRAQQLFDWVVRNVEIVPPNFQVEAPPLPLAVRGSGNSHERSWLFLELLRQAGLQGCMVALPMPNNPEALYPWLCGVIIEEKIYLFEPALGVPVPTKKGSVATLDELAKDPSLVEFFPKASGLSYFVTKEQLKGFSLLLIIEPQMVAPRMKFLESRLVGRNRPILYTKPETFFRAASTALRKIPDHQSVRLWTYPQLLRSRFLADPQYRDTVVASSNRKWLGENESARLLQLRGDHQDAIKKLVAMDLQKSATPKSIHLATLAMPIAPLERQLLVSQTPVDVLYFCGVSQLGKRNSDPEIATSFFDRAMTFYRSPLLEPRDVLNWGLLAVRLSFASKEQQPGVPLRVWNLLPEADRQLIQGIADEYQPIVDRAREDTAGAIRDAMNFQISGDKQRRIIEALNKILKKRDFYDPAKMPNTPFSPRIAALLGRDPESLTEEEIERRNRILFDTAFGNEIVPDRRHRLASLLRHQALAAHAEGDSSKAYELLETNSVDLLPLQHGSLKALSEWWKLKEKGAGVEPDENEAAKPTKEGESKPTEKGASKPKEEPAKRGGPKPVEKDAAKDATKPAAESKSKS